jgi:hypothetical protein
MSRGRTLTRVAVLAAVFATTHGPPVSAKNDFKIAPGPAAISQEEKDLAPDAGAGSQHGVILIEEEERDESLGTHTQVSYHLRAKIFSGEGRSLGDIEIPFNTKTGQLKQWWGRVVLPDGTSQTQRQEELKPQTLIRRNGRETRVLKGNLPGVVPGCVIDYGFVYWEAGVYEWTRVELQRIWPVKSFRFRWIPDAKAASKLRTTRTESLQVDVQQSGRAILITGKDLPPVPEEPWMPSDDAVRGIAHLYYVERLVELDDFWNSAAKKIDRDARAFVPQGQAKELVARMNIPPQADLRGKLKAAYDWIASNIASTTMLTSEEEETRYSDKDRARLEEDREKRSFADVLASKEALPYQIDYIFVGLAGALGAEANLVLATDRTDNYWDPGLLTTRQFDWNLVAVRAPGEPDDKATLVDAGSGLPYGEIPWLVTGARGLLATDRGYRELPLWPSDIEKNSSETTVDVSFAEDLTKIRWGRKGRGQQDYFTRRELRRLPPEDRKKRLDDLCGSGGDFEILKAEAPEVLADPTAEFRLECEGEYGTGAPDASSDSFSFKVDGAWFRGVPELAASTRFHPMVFSYPRIDRAGLEVHSPPGFAPKGAPAPVELESRFGRYRLDVKATPDGYHLEREFWFAPLLVKPDEYEPLRSFLQDVRKADAARLEFKRSGA